jgi:hypothetical protein
VWHWALHRIPIAALIFASADLFQESVMALNSSSASTSSRNFDSEGPSEFVGDTIRLSGVPISDTVCEPILGTNSFATEVVGGSSCFTVWKLAPGTKSFAVADNPTIGPLEASLGFERSGLRPPSGTMMARLGVVPERLLIDGVLEAVSGFRSCGVLPFASGVVYVLSVFVAEGGESVLDWDLRFLLNSRRRQEMSRLR